MNKNFTEILNEFEPEELDRLMKDVVVHSSENEQNRISALVRTPEITKKEKSARVKMMPRRAWIAIAACIALLAALGVGSYAYAAEAKEYKAAVAFFGENELSMEGLTRSELKAVYKDITTEKFSFDKTGEVLAHSLIENSVPGYDISTVLDSPEDVKTAWMELRSQWLKNKHSENKVVYCYGYIFKHGTMDVIASDLEKMQGNEIVWSLRIEGVELTDTYCISDGILATGFIVPKSGNLREPVIVKSSFDGKLMWRREAYLDSPWLSIRSLVELPNGDLAVVGIGGENAQSDPDSAPIWETCYARYTADGELINTNSAHVEGGYPTLIAPFGKGCIVSLEKAASLFIEEDGSFSNTAAYSEAGREYRIIGMMEYEGSLFLSCYSYPTPDFENGFYDEMDGVQMGATLDEIMEWYQEHPKWHENNEIYSDETFMRTLRENYQAVLLRIDPECSEPQVFYSMDGAFGGALELNDDGEMVWNVQRISSAGIIPFLNSHSYEILCEINRCRFDGSGNLMGTENTGEVEMIWR